MSNIQSLVNRYQKITPLFKTQKVQAYTMVTLSLFTISFFGFFAIRPTLKTIGTLQKQIIDRTTVNEKLEQKINSLILAQEEYKKIEPNVATIYSLLPEKPEITSLIIGLEDIGLEQNAPLVSIDISSVVLYSEPIATIAATPQTTGTNNVLGEVANNATQITFSLTYKGLYSDLEKVLEKLTKLNRIVTIKTSELKPTTTTEGALVVSLSTNTYYYPLDL